MKKTIIIILSLMLILPAVAQRPRYHVPYPQRRPSTYVYTNHRPSYGDYHHWTGHNYFGLRVGMALSNVSSDDAYLDGRGMTSGVSMGIVTGLQVARDAPVYFETGLSYTEKGGRGHYNGGKFTYGLNYIEVPLTLKYDYQTGGDVGIQPFIGGYMACGVGGKVKDFGMRQAVSSFDDDFFRRFDGGLRIGCGLEFSHLYAEVAYDFGLSNICHDTFNTSHNNSLLLSCGVNF